jgi:hypothetical protein
MLPPAIVAPPNRTVGAGASATTLGSVGLTLASTVGGATWGAIIGLLVAGVGGSKKYGHDAWVGAAWGAGAGGVLGLAAAFTMASASKVAADNTSTSTTGA